MNEALDTILSASQATQEIIRDGLWAQDDSLLQTKDGISLLSLKNHELLGYLHSLVYIIAGKIALTESEDAERDIKVIDEAIKSSIVHRISMEKGIKGLENKIAYQIEKVLRAYQKATTDDNTEAAQPNNVDSDSEDELNYRPNPMALQASKGGLAGSKKSPKGRGADEDEDDSHTKKYEAPKIAAVAPFQKERTSRRRNATMEEYIQESSAAPVAEPSIGSTIMDHGRGGERTDRDRKKQKEIQDYEEENYVRLPGMSKKQAKRAARQRQRDAFGRNLFGEDWSFLDRKSDGIAESSKRRKKDMSVWERAKKKQRQL
jgi:U3 small nucleolar ribonucleoprotein protein LCP5